MDVVGSEIGQKMRSAIKAKLTELGCYVDDELPDYVMVMVANKRTRAQMEDDLQLFLGENTELFVNWLHQVLKKLQEVTVTAPLKAAEAEKVKDSTKDKKSKDKKDKDKSKKSDSSKKSKKKDKEKVNKKKESKKLHKSKKKSKKHEMIRPNIPPLLMNIEKESEPSITDVFAGQILKNHGITLETTKEDTKIIEKKPVIQEIKRPIVPIIDPSTITSQDMSQSSVDNNTIIESDIEEITKTTVQTVGAPRDEQIKEMNEIEAKIQGLKQKLAEQLDTLSDDEDFLTIRTEAEELMNDFAEDVYQEITQTAPPVTPPISQKDPSPPTVPKPIESRKEPIEILPQIELKLPKRPVRERLGVREEMKKVIEVKEKETKCDSPERFTPEREPEPRPAKSARSRLDDLPDKQRKSSNSDESFDKESTTKKLTSKVSVLDNRAPRVSCASVVRVRPRPRVAAPASSLLLRAVADAQKSLLNIPPKVDSEPAKVKRALVLPMRRCVDAQKIVIQVQSDQSSSPAMDADLKEKSSKLYSEKDFPHTAITKKIINTDYVPLRGKEPRTSTRKDDTLVIETINIHNPTVDKQKDTQFIVTMDGYDPNVFLAKKLMTEGLLDDDDKKETTSVLKTKESIEKSSKTKESIEKQPIEKKADVKLKREKESISNSMQKKRLSDTSEESDTQVIIHPETAENRKSESEEKRKCEPEEKRKSEPEEKVEETSPPARKRKKSPIVFDVEKKPKKEAVRERTESVGSDGHVTVTTTTNTHKYDSVPPLSQAERGAVSCRSFPLCRFGAACAFQHPRCKFAASCTRRHCPYTHTTQSAHGAHTVHSVSAQAQHAAQTAPAIASHVVPVASFKTIQPSTLPTICKFYPNCVNPVCHFFHPKPCRYGKACLNKVECNFYHVDVPSSNWRYPV